MNLHTLMICPRQSRGVDFDSKGGVFSAKHMKRQLRRGVRFNQDRRRLSLSLLVSATTLI